MGEQVSRDGWALNHAYSLWATDNEPASFPAPHIIERNAFEAGFRSALLYARSEAQAAEKARPVGEVPEGWEEALRSISDAKGHSIVSGSPGPLYTAGWNGALEYAAKIARTALAAPSPPEGLGNKGFMTDGVVEGTTPAAVATPERALLWRMAAEYDRDDECDQRALNRMVEEGAELIGFYDRQREAMSADGPNAGKEKAVETTLSEINNDPT